MGKSGGERKAAMVSSIVNRPVGANGLVGELLTPEGVGPFPGVLCIGGSSGGVKTAVAPMLAKAGFAALSIGYFNTPGRPAEFVNLPLEYFVSAVDWLLEQSIVSGDKVGVTGTSRGSEAALQTATLTSKVGAVVTYVPSGIRWMGVDGKPSWTLHNRSLPYVSWQNDFGDEVGALAKVDRFNRVLDNPAIYAAAEIEVEQANCPMLLISGKDDQLWPSERMANLIIDRLTRHSYGFPYRHIAYPNAGHRIKVPGLADESYKPISEDTVTHELLQLGGTFEGNKSASEQSWEEVAQFFGSVLGLKVGLKRE